MAEDRKLQEAFQFLRQSEDNSETPSLFGKTLPYIISTMGRLFVSEYRIVQFLPNRLTLLSKCLISNQGQQEYLLLNLMLSNKFKEDRQFRIISYRHFTSLIQSLPMKGNFRVLTLYTETLAYSLLTLEQMRMNVTPTIHLLKHLRFFSEADNKKHRIRQLVSKEAGTLLHSVAEYYIAGKGWINNKDLLDNLYSTKLVYYNVERAIHTINYIIGMEMIQGGYQMMATEKLLEITNDQDDHYNFNRLDLILRNEQKVLVIDWKFTKLTAEEFMKKYKQKVQKYLKLATKYYNCKVQFHLYCIHKGENGILHRFTSKTVHKRIPEVTVEAQCLSDSDVQVIEHLKAGARPRSLQESKSLALGDRVSLDKAVLVGAVEQKNSQNQMMQSLESQDEAYQKHINEEIQKFVQEEKRALQLLERHQNEIPVERTQLQKEQPVRMSVNKQPPMGLRQTVLHAIEVHQEAYLGSMQKFTDRAPDPQLTQGHREETVAITRRQIYIDLDKEG